VGWLAEVRGSPGHEYPVGAAGGAGSAESKGGGQMWIKAGFGMSGALGRTLRRR
jgi:hypothetical protein